jgi:lysozyme family protein
MTGDPDFDYCVEIVLQQEGGFVDNPHDPGGATNFGISQRAYPNVDIRQLTETQAAQFYHDDYWIKFHCGDVPAHLDLWFLTACVMSGGVTATKLLQQLVGVAEDGIFGPHTLQAVKAFPSARYVEYLTLYAGHLMSLPGWSSFGKGWLTRLFRLAAL